MLFRSGHELSLAYDIPHGATLSVGYPAWLKLMSERNSQRVSRFGVMVFGTDVHKDIIRKTEQMFQSFESPIRLQQLKIKDFESKLIIHQLERNKVSGYEHKLTAEDYPLLLEYMQIS